MRTARRSAVLWYTVSPPAMFVGNGEANRESTMEYNKTSHGRVLDMQSFEIQERSPFRSREERRPTAGASQGIGKSTMRKDPAVAGKTYGEGNNAPSIVFESFLKFGFKHNAYGYMRTCLPASFLPQLRVAHHSCPGPKRSPFLFPLD